MSRVPSADCSFGHQSKKSLSGVNFFFYDSKVVLEFPDYDVFGVIFGYTYTFAKDARAASMEPFWHPPCRFAQRLGARTYDVKGEVSTRREREPFSRIPKRGMHTFMLLEKGSKRIDSVVNTASSWLCFSLDKL